MITFSTDNMRAEEIYEKETGNKQPSNQIAYHEWRIEYVKWLEKQVEDNYDSKRQSNNADVLRQNEDICG